MFDLGQHTPRLNITAPQKRCGKSLLMRLIGRLVPRPLSAESISAAVIYRVIELARPTFLLDEADNYLGYANPDRSTLIGIINSGHMRGGFAWRMTGEGSAMVHRHFRPSPRWRSPASAA